MLTRLSQITLVFGFFIIVLLPMADVVYDLDPYPSAEKKVIEKPLYPSEITLRSIKSYVGYFKYYLDSTHGLKGLLLAMNAHIKYTLIGVSPNQSVLLGKDGWLFLNAEGVIADFQRRNHLNSDELSVIAQNINQRRQSLLEAGALHYNFMLPNKHSIYAQQLPSNIDHSDQARNIDLINSTLASKGFTEIIDLTPAMILNKDQGRLFHKTDTHWNARGGYVAYQEISNKLSENFSITPLPSADLFIEKISSGGDLARMMGIKQQLTESVIAYKLPLSREVKAYKSHLVVDNLDVIGQPILHTNSASGEINKAIIYRDSFAEMLIPSLGIHFKEAIWVWQYEPDLALESQFQPDVIIRAFVERKLTSSMFKLTPENNTTNR